MQPPLRIAVLECDTPLEETRAEYGGYGGVFKVLLMAGADALQQPDLISSQHGLEITFWDVVNEQAYPDLDDIDAILLTGSRFNSFDNEPWITKLVDFTKKTLAHNRVRVIGVCFGHQIVGLAMGVKVARSDKGWEVSVSRVRMSEKGREMFGKDTISLHQMHKDMVYEWPDGVERLGSSDDCEVQGMHIKGRVLTIQGHPEFNATIVSEILASRHKQKILDDEIFDDAMGRVGLDHDGILVGRAFLNFLLAD